MAYFKYVCPECGKTIESVNKDQFDYNKEQHIEAHKRKGDLQDANKSK